MEQRSYFGAKAAATELHVWARTTVVCGGGGTALAAPQVRACALHDVAALGEEVVRSFMRIEVVPLLLENELGLHELLVLERLEPIALALDLLELTTAQLLVLAPRLELRLLVRLLFGEELRLLVRDPRLLLGQPRNDTSCKDLLKYTALRVTAKKKTLELKRAVSARQIATASAPLGAFLGSPFDRAAASATMKRVGAVDSKEMV